MEQIPHLAEDDEPLFVEARCRGNVALQLGSPAGIAERDAHTATLADLAIHRESAIVEGPRRVVARLAEGVISARATKASASLEASCRVVKISMASSAYDEPCDQSLTWNASTLPPTSVSARATVG